MYCPPVLGGQVAFLSFTPPPAAPPLRQGRNWLAIVAEGGILCVCVFGADTSVRPYGFVLEVLKVSKDFRVFKVSLAEIVYISRGL